MRENKTNKDRLNIFEFIERDQCSHVANNCQSFKDRLNTIDVFSIQMRFYLHKTTSINSNSSTCMLGILLVIKYLTELYYTTSLSNKQFNII